MADQASVSRPGAPRGQAPTGAHDSGNGNGVVGKLTGLGNDIANLVELQLKLAALDFEDASAKAKLPLVLIVAGGGLLLGSIPVLLFGVAVLLANALHVTLGPMLLLTALVAMAAAGALVATAGTRLAASLESFQRSREEFNRNVSWIRTVLLYSGRPRR